MHPIKGNWPHFYRLSIIFSLENFGYGRLWPKYHCEDAGHVVHLLVWMWCPVVDFLPFEPFSIFSPSKLLHQLSYWWPLLFHSEIFWPHFCRHLRLDISDLSLWNFLVCHSESAILWPSVALGTHRCRGHSLDDIDSRISCLHFLFEQDLFFLVGVCKLHLL